MGGPMKGFILIMTFGFTSTGYNVETIPGFDSEQQCYATGKKIAERINMIYKYKPVQLDNINVSCVEVADK